MTNSEKNIYNRVARLLYEEAKAVPLEDKEAVNAINALAYTLRILYDEELKYVIGFMLEIMLWMGHKDDAPDMAKNDGDIISESFPEIFESDKSEYRYIRFGTPYKNLARLLYEEAKAVRAEDKKAIRAIRAVARELVGTYDKELKYAVGFMIDIAAWMSLKMEGSRAARGYAADIKRSFPEVFS